MNCTVPVINLLNLRTLAKPCLCSIVFYLKVESRRHEYTQRVENNQKKKKTSKPTNKDMLCVRSQSFFRYRSPIAVKRPVNYFYIN